MAAYTSSMGGTFAWQGSPITEDLTRIDGIIAGCGEAALLVILNGLKGIPTSPGDLGNIIRNAIAAREVGRGGVSSPAGLSSIASGYGVTLQSGNLTSLVNQYAGNRPIIVGISNAQAFGGRDSGVFGHYVTIVGKTNNGSLIVNDPNQSAKFGQFDVYTLQEFINAHPFWAAVPSSWNPIQGIGTALGSAGQGVSDTTGSLFNIKWPDWFTNIGNWITGPNTWFNATRILKFVAGAVLIFIAFSGLISGDAGTMVTQLVPSPIKKAGAVVVPMTGEVTKAAAA